LKESLQSLSENQTFILKSVTEEIGEIKSKIVALGVVDEPIIIGRHDNKQMDLADLEFKMNRLQLQVDSLDQEYKGLW
jgi:hypothetical protein